MKVLLTGANGMDSSHLADILLERDYEVHGIIRKVSHANNTSNIDHIKDRLTLHSANLNSFETLVSIFSKVQPDWIFHTAAQSHVGVSFEMPIDTMDTNACGTLRILEAAKLVCPKVKIMNCMSSEGFGHTTEPQNEDTIFNPTSIYAVSKIATYYSCKVYRDSYGMFVANAISQNHEGPRRGENFVTRKITKAVARIKLGLQDELLLGNLDTGRDWGYSPDFCEAFIKILEHDVPDDFLIGTGRYTTLREFLTMAFNYVDLNWEDYVKIDQRYFRPQDHSYLCGDYSKAKRVLGWEPRTSLEQMVKIMIDNDLRNENTNCK